MNNILQDAYDMHVHAGPDVIPRRMDDLELAAAYSAAGMKGFVIKSHYWDTAGRAFLVRKLYPDLDAVGTLVLNHSVGGLNPAAVEMAARYGVRMVFMPTIDAWNMLPAEEKRRRRLFEGDGRPDDPGRHPAVSDTMSAARKDRSSTAATPSPIRILKDGQPVPEVDQILDIIKDNNMVLCSGHISPEETLALFKRAQEKGLRKLIATHVEWPPTGASFDMQKKYVSCGAYLEHCVINIMGGALSVKELTGQIHEIGAEYMILSTDLGQASNPDPVRALEEYASELLDAGVTKEDLRTMIVTNPAKLLAR